VLPYRSSVRSAEKRWTEDQAGRHGELFPCRNNEVSVPAIRSTGNSGLEDAHLQYGGTSPEHDSMNL
jgi:hypothetical protein